MNCEILSKAGGRARTVPLGGRDPACVPRKPEAMPGTSPPASSGGRESGELVVAVDDVVRHVTQLPVVVSGMLPQHLERFVDADVETFDEYALRLFDQNAGIQ